MRCGLELETETKDKSEDIGVEDTERPDALRSMLLGAQAVAFDWSVVAGRICWDVARVGGHDSIEYVCLDHCGPFRALLDREALRRLKQLMEEPFRQNPSPVIRHFAACTRCGWMP